MQNNNSPVVHSLIALNPYLLITKVKGCNFHRKILVEVSQGQIRLHLQKLKKMQ